MHIESISEIINLPHIRFALFVFTLTYLIFPFIHHIRRKTRIRIWQSTPTTRTYVHDDADSIDTPVDKADDAQLEFARLKQKLVEDDIIF